MFSALDSVVPKGKFEERHRWDYLLLRLNPLAVRKIRDIKDNSLCIPIIASETEIKPGNENASYVGTALRQFGYQSYEEGLMLSDLIERWKEEDENREEERFRNSAMNWLDDLHSDILRAVKNRDAVPTFNYFKSIRGDTNWWFRPAVTRARKFPNDAMEFDVYLYRVETPPDIEE